MEADLAQERARRAESGVTEEGEDARMQELKKAVRDAKRESRYLNDPYVAVSALMLIIRGGPRAPGAEWALHFECHPAHVTARERARCICPEHMSEGDARDNVFHKRHHRAEQMPPTRRAPPSWGRSAAARAQRARTTRQR